MPFMSGIVVSKQLFKTLCSFELAFVFLTPTTVETGTGYRMVSCFNCYISHSKVWDASLIFCKCPLNSSSFLSFHQESCPLNCALPMPGTADGDVVSRCQVLGRAGSVHHGADQ